jgi:hypothetical protein
LVEQLPLALQLLFEEQSLLDPQPALSPAEALQADPLQAVFGVVEQPTRSPERAAAAKMVFRVSFIAATVDQLLRGSNGFCGQLESRG